MRQLQSAAAVLASLFVAAGISNAQSLPDGRIVSVNETTVSKGIAENLTESTACANSRIDFCNSEACAARSECYFVLDAFFLRLDRARNQSLVSNQNTGSILLSTSDLDFDFEVGPRILLGFSLGERSTLEAVYFGLNHWNSSGLITGNNNLTLPGDLGLATDDFFGANSIKGSYSSEIHNAEFNYYRHLGNTPIEFLGGFRYVNLAERFNLHSTDSDAQESDYTIRTRNHLYGGQIGSRWRNQMGVIGVELIGKAGIYGNDVSQRTFVGDFDNTFTLRNSRTEGGEVAFVGELGLNGIIQVTRRVYLRGGYSLLWIEGVARASDQLDFTDTPASGTELHSGGSAFLHGANLGLEIRW